MSRVLYILYASLVVIVLTMNNTKVHAEDSLSVSEESRTLSNDILSIAAVGDIMMGTTFPREILPPDDGRGIFDSVADALKGRDVVFGNLEGPLLDGGKASKCAGKSENCYEFRTPVRYVKYLSEAGFNVINVANNHALDFGEEGLNSTVTTLKSAGIMSTGGEMVAIIDVRGKKIAVVGFSFSSRFYPYSVLKIAEAEKIVKELKDSNDIVIVSFHGGAEGKKALHTPDSEEIFAGEGRGNLVRFSRSVIDAGADMVIGHGPHVPRAMELYKGKLIAYSLGNFLTYGRFNIEGVSGTSLVLQADLDLNTGKFFGARIVSVKLKDEGIPYIDANNEAARLIKELTLTDIKESGIVIAEEGELVPSSVVAAGSE